MLLFYTLTTKYHKEKLRKQSHSPLYWKKKKKTQQKTYLRKQKICLQKMMLMKETEDYTHRWEDIPFWEDWKN